ncbi:MAG: hypothetical protein MUF04_04380 [Akkermansiaceae bacterium]|nr:hypothetical protein [Akkermansiaceae bacterium]
MQTTLRIDDDLYREAKAEAARSGVSLSRFVEEGLRLRLGNPRESARASVFRVYRAPQPVTTQWSELMRVAEEETAAHEVKSLCSTRNGG